MRNDDTPNPNEPIQSERRWGSAEASDGQRRVRRRRDERRDRAERQDAAMGGRGSITDVPLTGVIVAVVATVMLVLFLAWFFGEGETRGMQNIGGQSTDQSTSAAVITDVSPRRP